MNFKNRTLRSTNNFINLGFLVVNSVLSFLCAFNLKYAEFSDLALLLNINIFGLLPIYYFHKQFSNKGKYISILPLFEKNLFNNIDGLVYSLCDYWYYCTINF